MLLLGDVEQSVLVNGHGRSLALQLEDHYSIVMTGGEQIDLGVRSDHPEPVVLALEALDARSLVQVPDSDGLVFTG